jgi:hypothetical protein
MTLIPVSTPGQEVLDIMRSKPDVEFVILGEPASKANSRRMVRIKGKPVPIKSDKAHNYAEGFAVQVPRLFPLLSGRLICQIHIDYASELPDLDESLILDLMQVRVINNDRQIRARFVTHGIDRDNPKSLIRLWRWP